MTESSERLRTVYHVKAVGIFVVGLGVLVLVHGLVFGEVERTWDMGAFGPVLRFLSAVICGAIQAWCWPVRLWHFEWTGPGPDGPVTFTYP